MTVLLALLGCSTFGPWQDTGPVDEGGDGVRIVASPALLDFGTLAVEDATGTVATLTLYNLGDTVETLTGHDEPIGSDAFHVDAPAVLELGPGESIELDVTYAPSTDQADAAELLIAPSKETVRLSAVATAPVLTVAASNIPAVVLGCSGTGGVTLANEGSDPLDIFDARVEGDEYAVVAFPARIEPGQTAAVTLSFAPGGGGNRGTILVLSSNDPLRPEMGAAVSALGYEGAGVTESFRYTPSNPTDLLLVVATGGSMATQLDKAIDALPLFTDALRDANIDYHVAALSGGSTCPSSSPGWADRADTSLQTEGVLERGFLGESGSWDVDLLGLASEALRNADTGGCLDGFRRPEADLHVIVVSDAPSGVDVTGPEGQLDASMEAPAELRVSGLLPTTGTCGSPAPDYAAVAERHNGIVSDLCAPTWTDAFLDFTALPEGRGAVRFPLAEAPVPSTIEVLAEGVSFHAWSWDADTNAILFDGKQVPALGAEITVGYVLAVSCE